MEVNEMTKGFLSVLLLLTITLLSFLLFSEGLMNNWNNIAIFFTFSFWLVSLGSLFTILAIDAALK